MVKPTQVIHTVAALQTLIAEHRASGSSIGFVPTMGALHDGHLTLMQASKAANDITVCSIYVNPTQFDNKEDLAKYPKILDKDTDLLNTIGVDYTFAPSDSEVYPNGMGETITVDLGGLDTRLEGEHRPGHFAGVVQVVHRLLDIVKPDNLYMGQKDFQQFTIIQRMLDQLAMPVNLVVCPISRDPSGLARSSRNARLSELDKARACFLNQTLEELRADIKVYSIDALLRRATDRLTWSWTKLEYISIVDGHTLQHVHNIKNHKYVVAVLAVWIGGVRLIDNCTLLAE
jgi:pantoate--beta-alanine ligase